MYKNTAYTKDELYCCKGRRSFGPEATQAAFLLGGIGTGNISIGARGELRDWEIFNSPGKGIKMPYTYFAIWARAKVGAAVAKVLESQITPPFRSATGYSWTEQAGLPRLQSSTMKGEYPFVCVDFRDEDLPVRVSLEAFTPFIPLDADNSGIPAAIIRYVVHNPGSVETEVTVAGSMANIIGSQGYDCFYPENLLCAQNPVNEYRDERSARGFFYRATNLNAYDLNYGTMALLTSDTDITIKKRWLTGGFWEGAQDFWDDFSSDGRLEEPSRYDAIESTGEYCNRLREASSLGICHTLSPGETKTFEFVLSWHFPNRPKGWYAGDCIGEDGIARTVRNYYATLFDDAWSAGCYCLSHMEDLETRSRQFHAAMFGSTLPDFVIDALSANITVLRSPTCFRIEDGTLLGWEGCMENGGCCEGSCTHVWNYAQTMAFLFPELEQTMRRVEFAVETDETGSMAFRSWQVLGGRKFDRHPPAADGQLGSIVRLYRDWKLSGNSALLQSLWGKASKALDYAFEHWDADGDFVLDSQQHNTYDIEFYGPNSLLNSIFFAALKAGAEMAEFMGDETRRVKYEEALDIGSRRMDELLWGGEYYIQRLDDVDAYRYQYGNGCLSDQMLGQLLAHVAGLGYVLPQNHVREGIHSVFQYNFMESVARLGNVQRAFALNDEKGLVVCSWPKGGRPRHPLIYAYEVWTGIEYQVAAHLLYEGFVEEGLTIVKAVRDRQDGYKRNPWNEIECGNHYARSMSSWALLIALSGFRCDLVSGVIEFHPIIHPNDFQCFFSCGRAWGIFRQRRCGPTFKYDLEVICGNLDGVKVLANGQEIPVRSLRGRQK